MASVSSIISGLTTLGFQPTEDSGGQVTGLAIPGQGPVSIDSGSLVDYASSNGTTSLQLQDSQGNPFTIQVDGTSGQVTLTSANENFALDSGSWSSLSFTGGKLSAGMSSSQASTVSLAPASLTITGAGGTTYTSFNAEAVGLGGNGTTGATTPTRAVDIKPDGSADITFGTALGADIPVGAQITEQADGTINVATQSGAGMMLTDGQGIPLPVPAGTDYVATRIRQDGSVDFLDGNSGNWLNVAAPAVGSLQITTEVPTPSDGSTPPTTSFLPDSTPTVAQSSAAVAVGTGFSVYGAPDGSLDLAAPTGTGGTSVQSVTFAGPADNTAAVTTLYQGILGHAPTAAGLQYWVQTADTGVGLPSLVQAFVNSAEFTAANPDTATAITSFYQNILGRAPTAAGLQYWEQTVANGASLASVAAAFLESPAFSASPVAAGLVATGNGTWDVQFANASGVQVQQGGISANLGFGTDYGIAIPTAAGGTPQFITASAGDLPQQQAITGVSAGDTTAEVASLYQDILGRPATADGLQYWAQTANAGASLPSLIQAFVSSSEFTAANPDATTAINSLYQNMLGHAPDAATLQSWQQAASSGTSLATIAQDLMGTAEYSVSPTTVAMAANSSSGNGMWNVTLADNSAVQLDQGSIAAVLPSGALHNLVNAMAALAPAAATAPVSGAPVDPTIPVIAASTV